MSMAFASAPPPYGVDSQVSQTLTRYGTGGTRTVVQRDFAGDESLLIGINYSPAANPMMPSVSGMYQVVLRADDVVMVLLVEPFETGDVRRETLDRMLEAAIARAED